MPDSLSVSVARLLRALSLVMLVLLPIAAAVPSAGAAESVRIGGSGGALALVRVLADAFMRDRPDAQIEIMSGLGTTGAIRAAAEGAIDLAVTARPLTPAEAAKGLREAAFLESPFVFVTSHPAPGSIRRADVASYFTGEAKQWPDGTPVRIILRPRNDSDDRFLRETFPGMDAALPRARQRPDIPVAASDHDNAVMARQIRGSLTGATLLQVVTERLRLQLVEVDGVAPTLEAAGAGRYPYTRPFNLVTRHGEPAESLLRFLRFLDSPEADTIVRSAGCVRAAG